jgi:hypothetical protein
MKFHSPCRKCGSPVLTNRIVDWYGNKIMSVGCWNGHYEKIEIEGIERDNSDRKIKDAIPFIGFFNLP